MSAAILPLALLAVVIGWAYFDCVRGLASRWANEPDYSHGFLVPLFSAYLLWHRRGLLKRDDSTLSRWVGGTLILGSALGRIAAAYLAYPTIEAGTILPCLAGIALIIGGWNGLKWSWPAVLFLAFMIPLPGFLATRVSGPLQTIGTNSSTFILQTIGVPATSTGNIIHLTNPPPIGVVEACSGLRMLMTFFAITVGAAFILPWSAYERIAVVLSAGVIAIVANVTRIVLTGMVHEFISPEAADYLFHDIGGWLMMPLALLILYGGLALANRVFPQQDAGAGPLLAANN